MEVCCSEAGLRNYEGDGVLEAFSSLEEDGREECNVQQIFLAAFKLQPGG